MTRRPFVNAFVALSLLVSLFSLAFQSPVLARGERVYAPGGAAISSPLAPSLSPTPPQALPPKMPVYAILPTQVNQDIVLRNSAKLNGVMATEAKSTPRGQAGLPNFFAVNSQNGRYIDQFDQTGGLFALDTTRAFSETQMTFTPNNNLICSFLGSKNLFPANEIEPRYMDCNANPAYPVKLLHLSTVDSATGKGNNMVIGALVQVPLAINIGAAAPLYIPLEGPGGHLSLLLGGEPRGPSLDSSLPGLQALAAPMFERTRSREPIGFYNVITPTLAIQRFMAQFPPEAAVDPGTPKMVYYLNFPDTPQQAIMPTWTFPDATAIISGTVVPLKETTMPGVEGFAPEVQITSPAGGVVVLPDKPVSLTFTISGDKGPFSYTVFVDGNPDPVKTGDTTGGPVTLDLGTLPAPAGEKAQGHVITVRAVNTYQMPGEASVFLGPVQSLYMPIETTGSSPSTGPVSNLSASGLSPSAPAAPASTLRIGIEWVMNYHNPDSNLSQTKPDAEGLYNWLGLRGWAKSFNWGNDAAWEKDWRDCSLGGIDCGLGVDRAEFAYFSGHGSSSAWYFGVDKDYGGAWAGNARFQNVRWAAFSSCNTVRGGPYVGPGNPPLTEWFNAFQGAYMILGFHSVMGDIPFGAGFGFNMDNPIYSVFTWMKPSVAQAWVNTAFQMNAGKPAYLYAVGNFNPVNFKLPSANSGPLPPLTGIYQYRWVWWDE